MSTRFSTILVIPCYNEEKRVAVDFYRQFLSQNPDIFLLFVNDGSHDQTTTILEAITSQHGNTTVLSLPRNTGKGEAVRQGILHALSMFEFDYIGFADADLSTPLEEFHSFIAALRESQSLRIVLGSRVQMLGKNIQRSLFRHWFGRIIATGIGKVINEPVYDSQCGAKLFDRAIAAELFAEPFISKWLFDVELLSRYKVKYGSDLFKTTIVEIPVSQWTEKQQSKLRYHYFFRMMADLIRIRRKYFRAR